MEIVLGVSMAPTTIRMVVVEGREAHGPAVDHDVFDIAATDGAATSRASDQVVAAILGTRESALSSGHHLVATGVTWSDYAEAAALRESVAARGLEDVMLVSELHAAAALVQAAGLAVGSDTTALLFIERDRATLSVVETADGSVVKVLSGSLHGADAMAVLTEMVTSLKARQPSPEVIFVVGSGVDVTSVKAHLEHLVSLPVIAPDEPELALARGAALASANAPRSDASTVGLAYSQDPDGTTAGAAAPRWLPDAAQQLAGVGIAVADTAYRPGDFDHVRKRRKPFLLIGSSLTAIFAMGIVALVISLAVSIRPTADQRPSPGVVPSTAAPAPPAAQDGPPVQNARPAPALPPPVADTIQAPVPVVEQSPATGLPPAGGPPAPPALAPPPPVIQPPAFLCRHVASVCRVLSRR